MRERGRGGGGDKKDTREERWFMKFKIPHRPDNN
jgi:hypothetical protein